MVSARNRLGRSRFELRTGYRAQTAIAQETDGFETSGSKTSLRPRSLGELVNSVPYTVLPSQPLTLKTKLPSASEMYIPVLPTQTKRMEMLLVACASSGSATWPSPSRSTAVSKVPVGGCAVRSGRFAARPDGDAAGDAAAECAGAVAADVVCTLGVGVLEHASSPKTEATPSTESFRMSVRAPAQIMSAPLTRMSGRGTACSRCLWR